MNHADHRALQREILDRVLAILKGSDAVLGVVATGSFVTGDNDAFSDIDIDCYLVDEERRDRLMLFEQVSQSAPLLSCLWVYDKHALFLFENGVRLDLNFCKPSDIANESLDQCVILHDPSGVVEVGKSGISASEGSYQLPKWNPEDFDYNNWFFWMFRQVYCWTKRGEQGTFKSFNKLYNAIDSLAQIRYTLIEIRLWLHGSWDYLSQIDPAFAQRLSQTYPHCDAQDILRCTWLLLAEFEQLCQPYSEKRGISCPSDKLEILRAMLRKFDQVE